MKSFIQRLQAAFMAALLISPARTYAEEPQQLSFFKYSEPASAAPLQEARAAALKARETPVTNRGTFGHAFPIEVPPGRRGMTPQLTIQYDSGQFRRESAFGAGFDLQVGEIRRSTANGYPALEPWGTAQRYDDDAERMFEGPDGRLVELDCSDPSLALHCSAERAVGSRVFIPEVQMSPVYYEYRPAGAGAWVVYMPDGVRRYFGARTADAPANAGTLRVVNEYGTFSWKLAHEVDRFGNDIKYDYRVDSTGGPQGMPYLNLVRWGGNVLQGLADAFSVEIAYAADAGGIDFMSGGVAHTAKATNITTSLHTVTERYYSTPTTYSEKRTKLDKLGNVVSLVEGDAVSGFSRKSRVERDGFGRAVYTYPPRTVTALTIDVAADDGNTNWHRTEYDGFDRVLLAIAPDGREVQTSYAPRVVETVNPRGYLTESLLDSRGDVFSLTSHDGYDTTFPVLSSVFFRRDGLGRVVRIDDADGYVRRFAFDLGGRPVADTLPGLPGATLSERTTCFSNDDVPARIDTAAGRSIVTSYDGLARPLSTSATKSGAATASFTFVYDDAASEGLGRLRSKTDPSGTTTYAYDPFGRVSTATYVASSAVKVGFDASATYTYDLQNRINGVLFGGKVPSVGLDFQRDPLGRVREILDQNARSISHSIGYDAYGRVISADFAASRNEWYYDAQTNALTDIIVWGNTGAPLLDVKYEYDDNLNVWTETRTGAISGSKTHDYDGLDRLTSSSVVLPPAPAQLETYSYSPGGFIETAAGMTYSWSSSSNPQAVTSLLNASGTVVRSLTYDLDGFAISDGTTSLKFDGAGCLTAATRMRRSVERLCSADGDEVFRSTDGTDRVIDLFGLAEYRMDAKSVVFRLKVNQTAIAEEYYDSDASSLTREDSKCRVLHTDVRGSVVATSTNDAVPTVKEQIEYDSWGATLAGATLPVHRFIDEEQDAFGYYTFGKRTYSPTLRRWLSPDPLIRGAPEVDASGRQLDLYSYAANNPVARTDREGTIAPLIVMGIVGIAVGIMGGFESDTVVVDENGEEHGGANLALPLAMAAAPMVAATVVEAGVAGAASVYAAGEVAGPMLGFTAAEGAALAEATVGTAVVVAGAGGASIATTAQMANRGEGGGSRTDRKVSRDARENGQQRLDAARKALQEAKGKPNKTPADKALIKKLEGQVKQAEKAIKPSEQHAQKQQGPSR